MLEYEKAKQKLEKYQSRTTITILRNTNRQWKGKISKKNIRNGFRNNKRIIWKYKKNNKY